MNVKNIGRSAMAKRAALEKQADTPKVNFFRTGRPAAPHPLSATRSSAAAASGTINVPKAPVLGANLGSSKREVVGNVTDVMTRLQNQTASNMFNTSYGAEMQRGTNANAGMGDVDPTTGRLAPYSGTLRNERAQLGQLKQDYVTSNRSESVSRALAAISKPQDLPHVPWYRPIKRYNLKRQRSKAIDEYIGKVPSAWERAANVPELKNKAMAFDEGRVGALQAPRWGDIEVEQGDPLSVVRDGVVQAGQDKPTMIGADGGLTIHGKLTAQDQIAQGFLRQAQSVGIDRHSPEWRELHAAFAAATEGGPGAWVNFMSDPAVQKLKEKLVETGKASPIDATTWLRAVGIAATRTYDKTREQGVMDYRK